MTRQRQENPTPQDDQPSDSFVVKGHILQPNGTPLIGGLVRAFDQDYANHVDYIHYNPMKHGYVEQACNWRHSSIHRYIAAGIIDQQWATDLEVGEGGFGER